MTLLKHQVYGIVDVDLDYESKDSFVVNNYKCAPLCEADKHYLSKRFWREATNEEIKIYLSSKYGKNVETDSVVTPQDAAVKALVNLLDSAESSVVLAAAELLLRF